MWILIFSGVLMDSVQPTARTIQAFPGMTGPLMLWVFFLYMLLAYVTVMNMLIGVLCEIVANVADAEKEKRNIEFVKHALLDRLFELDTDGDRELDSKQFDTLMGDQSVIKALEEFGVDVDSFIMMRDSIFQDPSTRHPRKLTFAEFLEKVLQLRSDNQASVMDIVRLQNLIIDRTNVLEEFTKHGHKPPGTPETAASATSDDRLGRIERALEALRVSITERLDAQEAVLDRISDQYAETTPAPTGS